MKKINLYIRRKDLVSIYLPLLALIVVLFLSKNFLLPEINQLIQEKKELDKNLREGELLKTKALFLQNLDRSRLEKQVKMVSRALPVDKDIASILETLDYLRNDSGVLIDNINLKPGLISTTSGELSKKTGRLVKKRKTSFNDFIFSVSLSGSHQAVEKFIEGLNQSARLFKIETAKIEYKNNETRAKLTLVTFYLPLPQSIGGVFSPLPELSPKKQQLLAKISQLKSPLSTKLFFEEEKGVARTSRKNLFSF